MGLIIKLPFINTYNKPYCHLYQILVDQLRCQQIIIEGLYSLQINFINKRVSMKSRFERRDKENTYNAQYLPRSRTPVGSNINNKAPLTPSNSQLRKKLDENYQKLLSHDQARQLYQNTDYQSSKNRGKRSNAKNRGFDQKVSNITTINDKINSLLNMVKKDKQNERNQKLDKLQRERAVNRSRETDSPSIDIVQQFRKQQPSVSPFTKEKFEDREFSNKNEKEQRYSVPEIQQYQFNTKYQEGSKKQNESINVVSSKQGLKEEGKDLNLKHLRRKYLPEQELPSQKHKRQASGRWERPNEEQDSRYDYTKIYQRNNQNTKIAQKESHQSVAQSNKTKNIDKMLEDRKKKRQQQREEERAKFEQSIKPSANSYQAAQYKKSSTLKQGDNLKQYQYTNTERNHNLTQVNPAQQNHRNQKINTATRLIDEQIEKIKSKIQQSENNNERNQKKLSSHKKGLSSSHVENKQHTTKLANKISGQVQLDTKLRQARVVFDKISGEQKWTNLQQQLKTQGMKLTLEFIKELIKISSDQRNPFTGQVKTTQSCSDIASLFAKAQKNWENEVCGITSMNDLIGEGFNTAQLDLSQKGSLGLEDLVCFINLYTGHFYRNRDLALIFRRIQLQSGESGNTLTYQGFQTTLTV